MATGQPSMKASQKIKLKPKRRVKMESRTSKLPTVNDVLLTKKNTMKNTILKCFLLTVITLCLMSSLYGVPAGDGLTQNTAYEITSAEDLQWVANNRSIWYSGQNTKKYFKQTADISMPNGQQTLSPIGSGSGPDSGLFVGEYDGQGYTISNLVIVVDTGEYSVNNTHHTRAGLFAIVANNSVIKNVRVTNHTVTSYDRGLCGAGEEMNSYAGGIVAELRNSIIENCAVYSGVVRAEALMNTSPGGTSLAKAGGIVGYSEVNSQIKNCFSKANVWAVATQRSGFVGSKYARAGGIAGEMRHTTIEYCYSSGIVQATTDGSYTRVSDSGGVVGHTIESSTVRRSYATGQVTANYLGNGSQAATTKGGIVGRGGLNYTIQYNVFSESTGINADRTIGDIASVPNNKRVSDSAMTNGSTFTVSPYSWNFTTTWRIGSNVEGGRPALRAFYPAATLVSPADYAQSVPVNNVNLTWKRPSGPATAYDVYIGTSSNPSYDGTVTGTSVTKSFDYETTYYWRVVAVYNGVIGETSATRRFTTAANPPAVTLDSPGDNAIDVPIRPTFTWNTTGSGTVSGFHIYRKRVVNNAEQVSIYNSSDPSQNRVAQLGASARQWPVADTLMYGTSYDWQVVAIYSDRTPVSSATRRFTTVAQEYPIIPPCDDPLAPIFVNVSSRMNGQQTQVIISWSKPIISNPDGYIVYMNGAPLTDPLIPLSPLTRQHYFTLPEDANMYILFGVQSVYTYRVSTSTLTGYERSDTISHGATSTHGGHTTIGHTSTFGNPNVYTGTVEIERGWEHSNSTEVVTSISTANSTGNGLEIETSPPPSQIAWGLFINNRAHRPRDLAIATPNPMTHQGEIFVTWEAPVGYENLQYNVYINDVKITNQPIFVKEHRSTPSTHNIIVGNRYAIHVTAIVEGIESAPSDIVYAYAIGGIRPSTADLPGSGNPGDFTNPFLIADIDNLRWLSEYAHYHAEFGFNGWWRAEGDRMYFKQTADIDASSTRYWNVLMGGSEPLGFRPIGYNWRAADNWFFGEYDGNGYTISNLYINFEHHGLFPVGLFSVIGVGEMWNGIPTPISSTIRNVTLINPTIKGNGIVGGIVGEMSQGAQVINCQVIGGEVFGYAAVGGIAGSATSGSIIENSHSSAVIYGNVAGGIAGNFNSATIKNSFSNAVIHGGYAGEIVGLAISPIIENVYAMGAVNPGHNINGGYEGRIGGYSLMLNDIPELDNIANNIFWVQDTSTTNQMSDFGFNSGNTTNSSEKTPAEMRLSTTFSNWPDFNTKWEINPDRNWGFPYLKHPSNLPTDPVYLITGRARSLTAEYENGNIILTWLQPEDSGAEPLEGYDGTGTISSYTGSLVSYNVYRDGVFLASTTSTTYSDDSAAPGVEYAYYVTVNYANPTGESAPSNTFIFDQSVFDVSPISHSFGNIEVGQSSIEQIFTITNTGTSNLVIRSISIPPSTHSSQFSLSGVVGLPWAIEPNGSRTFSATFSPLTTGLKDGVYISINDRNEEGNTRAIWTISLSGTGTQAAFAVSPTIKDFGNIAVGQSSTEQTFTITNTGTSNLVISSITIPTSTHSNQFCLDGITGLPWTIIPNGTQTFSAIFSPTSTGLKNNVNITINDNLPNPSGNLPDEHSYTITRSSSINRRLGGITANSREDDAHTRAVRSISLSGTGVQAAFAVSPTSHNFGNIVVGQPSAAQNFTITNTGGAPLIISSITIPVPANGFAIINNHTMPLTIPPVGNNTRAFQVIFTPPSVGSHTANIVINDNIDENTNAPTRSAGKTFTQSIGGDDGNVRSTHSISLQGVGISYDLAAVSITGPATVIHTVQSTYNILLQNLGATIASGYTVKLMRLGSDTALGTDSSGTAIAVNGTREVSINWVPPANLTTGSYLLYGKIEWALETNPENNNTPNYSVTITSLNDISAVSLQGPTTVTHTIPTQYTVGVQNSGTAPASAYTVSLMRLGSEIALAIDSSGTAIVANGTRLVTLNWEPPATLATGAYLLYGKIDWPSDVNPENNTTPNYNVTLASYNDLEATSIQGPTNITHTIPVQYTVNIRNNGTASATGYIVNLMLQGSDTALATDSSGIAIAVNGARNITLNWVPPATLEPDSYQLYGQIIWEMDTNIENNTAIINVILEPVSDIDETLVPNLTKLDGNYPNPFNPETTIRFSLAEAGSVSIEIFSLKGQLVRTLVNEGMSAGSHRVVWNGKDFKGDTVSSGVYFYRMRSGDYQAIKRMLLLK